MPNPTRGRAREIQLIVSLLLALGAPLAYAAKPSQQFLDSLNRIAKPKSGNGALGTVAPPAGRITNWFMTDGTGSKSSGGKGRIIVQPGGGGGGGELGEPESAPPPASSGAEPPAGPVYTGGGSEGGAPPPTYDPNAPMPAPPAAGDIDPNAPFADSPWNMPDTPPNPAPTTPSYPPQSAGPMPAYPQPNAGAMPAYPQPNGGAMPGPGYPPPSASYPPAQTTSPYNSPAPPLYAGMAYEVHALGRDGRAVPVDPSTYAFRTGDRFVVYYRPSLPGRVDVVNINPRGIESPIDVANVAGGQLVTLGPYEFASTTGDESLRLVLTPCNSPALLAATRDIVKVAGGAMGASAMPLAACSAATRGIKAKTRDIRRAEIDGGTSYALDAVSQQELITGQYASRQVTITFHHPY